MMSYHYNNYDDVLYSKLVHSLQSLDDCKFQVLYLPFFHSAACSCSSLVVAVHHA